MVEKLKMFGDIDVPEYCHTCGKRLVMTPYSNGYDTKTGIVNVRFRLKCPKWWPHAVYDFDEKGNEILER